MSVILDHMLKCKTMVVNERSAKDGFNLGLGSADHVALKSRISLSRSILAVQKFVFSFFFFLKKKKLYAPFLWIGFNCLKATEPLRGDRLLFNVQFPGILGIQLSNLRMMKG